MASDKVVQLEDSNFEEETKSGYALIDFWAAWCGPCVALAPLIDEIAGDMDGKLKVCKLDVDKNMQTAARFGVRGIPYIVLLKDGKSQMKIIAGRFGDSLSPAKTFTKINIFELEVHRNSEVNLNFDEGTNTLILQLAGKSFVGDQVLDDGCLGIFDRDGTYINLQTSDDSKSLILNGEPIDEPLAAHGPFVMNTRDELIEAFKDFHEGKMGNLPN